MQHTDFIYLKNIGGPTSWDATDYMAYIESISAKLPPDLVDMTSVERFHLGTRGTLWHAQLVSASFSTDSVSLTFQSNSSELLFTFSYAGVVKVINEFSTHYCLPSLIVQELVLLKGRLYRHVMSGLGGDKYVIYARHVGFAQLERQ